jgi:hypothetical protein
MPDAWGRFTDTAELAAAFTHFATKRCGAYAPLYARLGVGIADDPGLLAIAANAAPGQSPPDLMLAAVHYLLAGDADDSLARYYPSLRFAAATGDPVPDFLRFCLQRRGELVELISSRRVHLPRGAGRFRTCAGAGPRSLVWRRAGTCLPALARHEAPRGVPVQVGNRSAATTPGPTL